ncbi:MAG: TlyA family RNA methyltransferase [Syntrophomonadaceae bacterium]|nr:TlyA family RNA methyltransferase [Syntrophomonadaceae bacterium]
MGKIRLDTLIHQKGLTSSRERARALIMSGEVRVNGQRVDKPGTNVNVDVQIEINNSSPRYVSRGGLKLEKAIQEFQIDFSSTVVLDVGASTGGYTDCALQNGARKVFAVDVGYGQLDWKLRNDKRVINLEKTNIRYLNLDTLGEKVDIITVDVSFISTRLVFPVLSPLLKEGGLIIALIKPQFEAGKKQVGKKGVVRDAAVHREVLKACIKYAEDAALSCTGITFSPITGPRGNIEFFIKLEKSAGSQLELEEIIDMVVNEAHKQLGG